MDFKNILATLSLLLILTVNSKAQESMTIAKAIATSLEQNSDLQAAMKEQAAAQHGLGQAARLPNPELEVETENLGSASTTLMLAQPVELGGKRSARIGIARADSLLAAAGLESRRAAVIAETHRRFYRALGHQKQIEQLDSLILFAESTKTTIERQVENGRAGKTDLLRSMKDITLLRIERNTLVRGYETSLRTLGALWGSAPGAVKGVSGELHSDPFPHLSDSLRTYLERCPALKAAQAEIEAAKAREAASRAERFPDFSLRGGYVRDPEADDDFYVVGASMGLPLFNRNRDGIDAARNKTEATGKKAEAIRNELSARLMQRFGEIDQLKFRVVELKDKIIPQTGEILAEIRRLFDAGKSSYADLIATQRDLVDAWRDYLTTETEIRLAIADIIELTGKQ